MQAMRLFEQAPLRADSVKPVELPLPIPGEGQIRLRVRTCGVCHTDLHTIEGDIHPPHLPITPGHQVVGVVDQLGPSVSKFKVGDRAGVPWLHRACGVCEFCTQGLENLCPFAEFTGFHIDGGYAEYMLADARYALPLPEGISDEDAAPLLCAGIVGYRSLKLADLQPGERLGLVGFGASAHLSIQVARHWGCRVFVFTRSPEHQQHALQLGAEWSGESGQTPPEPLDRAVIFAPSGALVPPTLAALRPAGTLAINAIHTTPIPEMPYDLIYCERTLRSVANATYQDGVEFMQLAAEIPIHATITTYPLADANRALDDMKYSRINGEAVLVV